MLLNIIMAVSFVPIWPIFYFFMKNYAAPHKNIILGTTLPHEAQNDPDTLKICGSFKKWMNMTMLPMLPLLLPPFFMESMGAAMTWFMTWLLIVIVAPFVVFAKHHGKLTALKRERNWSSAIAGRTIAEVKAAGVPVHKISGLWFLPPFIAALFPFFTMPFTDNEWAFGLKIVCVTNVVTIILFCLFYHLIFRSRAEAVNEDVTLTMALTRVRRYNWGKFWIIVSWITGALNLSLWAFNYSELGFLISVLVYTMVTIIAAFITELTVRTAQQKLTAGNTGDSCLDDDDYWLFGFLYNNPNDEHLLVNARVGMNMSINLAKPAGKVYVALGALCIAALPFMGIWMWTEEVTPAKLVLSETELTAHHTRDQYIIALDTIKAIEILDELPTMTRTAGSGFRNLSKGNFNVTGYGASRICLQPKDPPFLLIQSDGKTYILNDADSSVTRDVYNKLANIPLERQYDTEDKS